MALNPQQEEMAMAWAQKVDTPYVDDPVFQANFLSDFLPILGIDEPLSISDLDFSAYVEVLRKEQARKKRQSPEERKAQAQERKAAREELKQAYGYAIVDGLRVELGNYMAEPSGLFMGRGQHPLRGRWKQGAQQSDISLNLSPDAPMPEGDWKECVWVPDSMWVARWLDKLSNKVKYVWLADTTPVKQVHEAAKFDKATRLQDAIERVRAAILQDMADERPRTRMIATACYLIDALCLRVGDEKDPDEADTVGATTLRPEHLRFMSGSVVAFHFLGKDSVEWRKKIKLPPLVRANLEQLVAEARPSSQGNTTARDLPQIFPDIGSSSVNQYLSAIMPGLSAKVFRTFHATNAVWDSLTASQVKEQSPEYAKWQAVSEANLQAAVLCNHTRKAGVNWATARKRYDERLAKAEARRETVRTALQDARQERQAAKQMLTAQPEPDEKAAARLSKSIDRLSNKINKLSERSAKADLAVGKIKAQMAVAQQKRTWNLSTSLKSYIDPRVYHRWGQQVGYDVLAKYYPTILQRKFAWVRLEGDRLTRTANAVVVVRTCLAQDVEKLVSIFAEAGKGQPGCQLPATAEEISAAYLPSLDKPWCEAIIACDEAGRAVGMAVLGPERQEGKLTLVGLFAILAPGETREEVAEALAVELQNRFRTYQVHHPKQDSELDASDLSWVPFAPEVAEILGLTANDDDALDETAVEEPSELE